MLNNWVDTCHSTTLVFNNQYCFLKIIDKTLKLCGLVLTFISSIHEPHPIEISQVTTKFNPCCSFRNISLIYWTCT